MDDSREALANLIPELKRGTVVLAVLGLLGEPVYGYSLIQLLLAKGVEAEANTLYPLLRRLEKQGLLTSSWETTTGKPRKYYTRTEQGTKVFAEMKREWNTLAESIRGIVEEEGHA